MNCDDAEVLLRALVDGEIDVGHACDIESHLEACPFCAAQLRLHRAMRAMMSHAALRFLAPQGLRTRIRTMLPAAVVRPPSRHTMFKGFAFGSALSAAAAALLMIVITRSDQDQVIVSDVVSAHLRSGPTI